MKMKQLNSRQLARNAKDSIDKYLKSGDLKHLKDAKLYLSQAQVKDVTDSKFLEMKARNYS